MRKTNRWFHGTDSAAAARIEQEGLLPDINKFDFLSLVMENPAELDARGFIYLTPFKIQAEHFAQFRTAFTRTPVGKQTQTHWSDFGIQKLSGNTQEDAEPVVLEFEIPEALTASIESDPTYPNKGFRFKGTIPASFIKAVHRISKLCIE